jgi:hypothetical protein
LPWNNIVAAVSMSFLIVEFAKSISLLPNDDRHEPRFYAPGYDARASKTATIPKKTRAMYIHKTVRAAIIGVSFLLSLPVWCLSALEERRMTTGRSVTTVPKCSIV